MSIFVISIITHQITNCNTIAIIFIAFVLFNKFSVKVYNNIEVTDYA